MGRDSESSGSRPERESEAAGHHAALIGLEVEHPAGLLDFHYGLFGPDAATPRDALLRSSRKLVQGCELVPGQRILDAGCGLGGTAVGLAQAHGVHVIGLTDRAPDVEKAAEYAEQQGVGDLVEFHHGDFMDLPYPDASFDIVLNHESVCHAADKPAYLKGVHRVLKPGGRWQALDVFLNGAVLTQDQEETHAAVYRGRNIAPLADWRDMLAALEEAGFERLEIQDLASDVARFSALLRNRCMLRGLLLTSRSPDETYEGYEDAISGYDQGLREGLFTYCFLSGEKAAPRPARDRAGITGGGALAPGLGDGRETRQARSRDFGKITRKIPAAVALPRSADEVAGIVRWAAQEGMPLTVRGGAHSQGGQTLTDRGVVIDTARLYRIRPAGRDFVRAQGGAQWGQVVDALWGTRRYPCVLADVPDVTVGGTLSAGGLGDTSHRYGVQAGQVEQLEVVIGTGERVRCSRTRNRQLFDAVRAGQGQFGLITEAWIRLRKGGTRLRQYALRYRDFGRFADNFEAMIGQNRFDHLRVEMKPLTQEIILIAGKEYNHSLDSGKLLAGLGHESIASEQDTDKVGRAGMMSKTLYGRNMFCPWRDWILPWESLRTVLEQPWLDRNWLSGTAYSWTGLYPVGTETIDAPLFARPSGQRAVSYSILATLPKREEAGELARRLRQVDRALVELGGKSYLSGAVGYGRKEWREHYRDEQFETALGWKSEFDPHNLFGGEGLPFSKSPA